MAAHSFTQRTGSFSNDLPGTLLLASNLLPYFSPYWWNTQKVERGCQDAFYRSGEAWRSLENLLAEGGGKPECVTEHQAWP